MMATTHALFGVALATVALVVAPEFGTVALVAAVAGSVFPDLDLYAGHRRTLHYPVYFSVAAVFAAGLAAGVPGAATIALAFFLAGAAVHSASDALGGGLELRPWQATSERAVYDHFRGRWIRPRRWVRYDGAPEDLLVAVALGVPALAVYDRPVQLFVAAVLLVSAGYVVLRKRLAAVVEHLAPKLPPVARSRLPDRFQAGGAPSRGAGAPSRDGRDSRNGREDAQMRGQNGD